MKINKCYSDFNLQFVNFLHQLQNKINYELINKKVLEYVSANEKAHLETLNSLSIKHFNVPVINFQNQKEKENTDPINNDDNNNVEIIEENNYENKLLKQKFLETLQSKDPKRHFQVYYVFKNRIKRMYRIDCMTRKINV